MSLDEVGARIENALSTNATSWVGLNLAGLYWRALGNATQVSKAMEVMCLGIIIPRKEGGEV